MLGKRRHQRTKKAHQQAHRQHTTARKRNGGQIQRVNRIYRVYRRRIKKGE